MLNSFEFFEQDLDCQEPNLNANCNSNPLINNEKNSMLSNNLSKEDQNRKQAPGQRIFDNLITQATVTANLLPLVEQQQQQINKKDMNLLSNLAINKSTGKNKNQPTNENGIRFLDANTNKVVNYLQRDLTLLTISNETETPSPAVEVNLDDYDDIQTVAANCNVTEYLNSSLNLNPNLSDSPAQVKNTEVNKIKLPVVLNENLNNLSTTIASSPACSTTSSTCSSIIKSNRFVKEDSNNKFRLFKPVKISLKDSEQKKQNTLKSTSDLTTDLTTDLIKKENKEQKDDSQIILAGNLEVEKQVKEKLTMSKLVVVKSKLVKEEEEEKIRTNDQLVDHLIEKEEEEAKIDSENNRNLKEKKRKNNYTLDQAENEELKQVDGQLNLSNLTNSDNSGTGSVDDKTNSYKDNSNIKCSEKYAEQINAIKLDTSLDDYKLLNNKLDDPILIDENKKLAKHKTSFAQTKDEKEAIKIMMINQMNLNNKQTIDNTLNDKMHTKSTELELINEQAIRNQSNETVETIGTSIKLENKNESKLDKKSNQSKIKLTKDKIITIQLNHASKTGKRTLSSTNSNGQTQTLLNQNQQSAIAKTRPKIIELTKSTNGLKNSNTSNTTKLKRSPSAQSTSSDQSTNSTNLNNLNHNSSNKKNLTATNKNSAITNGQTSNKNINQIKGKTMTSTLKRIISRTVDTVQTNSSTINNSLNNAINNKSIQLKTNSIKTNLISKKTAGNSKNELNSKQSNINNNSKELDQVNTLKKSTIVRKTNSKLVNNSSTGAKDISSASSSAASSVASSSVNLTSSNANSLLSSGRSSSQLSIATNNQVKVKRSSSLLAIQRTNSLKQQLASPSNNQLPRRSKSISVNSLISNDKPSLIPKVKSKEDVRHQQKIDNFQSKDVQLLKNNSEKQNNRVNEEDKSTVNMKMNDDENNKINNDLTKLIQVTDQISIKEKEGELLSNGCNDNVNITQTNRSEDNQSNSKKSSVTSPNANSGDCNEMTSNINSNNLKFSNSSTNTSKSAEVDLHATSSLNEERSQANRVQCTDRRSQLQIDEQLTNNIDLQTMVKDEEKNEKLIDKNSNLPDNQLNKSEIDYLTKCNSKIELNENEKICEYSNKTESNIERGKKDIIMLNDTIINIETIQKTATSLANTTPDHLTSVEKLSSRKIDCTANGGGVCETLTENANLKALKLNDGAQHQVTNEKAKKVQNISRKEKLSQFKSNDQQVKQQINELIECVKQSEFVLNQTIDCQPLTIEIFDDLEEISNLKSKSKLFNHNYDLQCESTNETTATNSTASDQKTDKFTNMLLLDQQPINTSSTNTTTKDQPIMKNVTNSLSNLNTNSAAKFNKIVNNKITNSSKTSDLGGSSSATSSSDESTTKSPNELDVDSNITARTNLTRKDSVSSSSSSVCSSGSSSGVSSSHSGQFNQHVNSPLKDKQQLANDLLLQITTNTPTDSQWIKQTKCSPSFKLIEQKVIGQIDLKNSDKINSEQLINKASIVDASGKIK